MRKHPSKLDLWERARRRDKQAGRIITGVLAFFALMAFSQGVAACDVLGGIILFCAGLCLVKTVYI